MMYKRALVGCILFLLASCSGNVEEKLHPVEKKQSSPENFESDTLRKDSLVSPVNDDKKLQKLALIVAVGNYAKIGEYPFITAESHEWRSISSDNDAPLIKAALRAQGFPEKNITVLEDKQATHAGIIGAIRMQLIDKARAGDIVVFHFSG